MQQQITAKESELADLVAKRSQVLIDATEAGLNMSAIARAVGVAGPRLFNMRRGNPQWKTKAD
ncbi:hypothetical protein [Nesterenkonia sandarakina]|uniref:Uncharacterized protein n=1 Tax=Nesterenkonia sandarakina TaxID=272918 RepID=A0A7Z0E6W6_9MICC|nr:hypothetical protein [Nesterenkonia sandarakina]NYJ15984.1 hypothetical protein [Nesterenkonia sandarakina]